MEVIITKEELRKYLFPHSLAKKKMGLVPTMGALHDGHLKLVEMSVQVCDITVVSIFVNPTQFNDPKDLVKYPRTTAKDIKLLESVNCDIVFIPTVEEMYPNTPKFNIELGQIESILEGEHRPDHFQGVALIVSELFKIVRPTHAFFGQKDLQQFYVVRKLIQDLNFDVNLIQVPIVRDSTGLALSSRNSRLSSEERRDAAIIYRSLQMAKSQLLNGVKIHDEKTKLTSIFAEQKGMELEYFEMVDMENFTIVSNTGYTELALCIAVNVGDVRLIDNVLLFS